MSNAARYAIVNGMARRIAKCLGVVDGKNRRIYKSYVVVNGKTCLRYIAETLFYTGTMTQTRVVDTNGVAYDLYTLTTGGELLLYADNAIFWMCGGGAGGESGSGTIGMHSGGGGGGGFFVEGELLPGKYTVVIGAGGRSDADGTASAIGNITAKGGHTGGGGVGGNGGSGGGGGVYSHESNSAGGQAGGSGSQLSTIPFAKLGFMSEMHCAGGGGGDYGIPGYADSTGGQGGSDGFDGYRGRTSGRYGGGEKGGGAGGIGGRFNDNYATAGNDATFYGSGGGGGGGNRNGSKGAGGSGYQGVVYIAVRAG